MLVGSSLVWLPSAGVGGLAAGGDTTQKEASNQQGDAKADQR